MFTFCVLGTTALRPVARLLLPLALLFLYLPNTSAQTDGPVDGTYRILSKLSGKALSVDLNANTNGGFFHGRADGTNIFQFGTDDELNRQWRVTPIGGGRYRIVSEYSRKALSVADGSQETGANVLQWAYGQATNQQWQLEPQGEGYFNVVAIHSGKALGVADDSRLNRANVIQAGEPAAEDGLLWQFDLIAERTTSTTDNLHGTSLTVYPNPTSGRLHLDGLGTVPAEVSLIDPTGRLVRRMATGGARAELDVSGLPGGTYVLRVVREGTVATRKVLVR